MSAIEFPARLIALLPLLLPCSGLPVDDDPLPLRGVFVAQEDPGAAWDRVYKRLKLPEVTVSSSFPAYCADRLAREKLLEPGSKVLALAMGEGRNEVFFAGLGFDVTGIDISPVAIEQAEQAAKEKGVALKTVKADLFQYDLGREQWDLVTNIYFNPAIKVFDRIKDAVRPGGFVLVEGYGADYKGEGPPASSRYGPNQLLKELEGWRILEYQDGVFPCVWQQDKAVPVVRVLARKPK
ncbi:MAG: class I SAM-dependent methyltransferase [Planctomycetota bacterium]